MKLTAAVLLIVCLLSLTACHSGIMRGTGEDISSLGNKMQSK